MIIFICGTVVGGGAGLVIGLRAGSRVPSGPHARALHTHPDQTVILVEDALSPGEMSGSFFYLRSIYVVYISVFLFGIIQTVLKILLVC